MGTRRAVALLGVAMVAVLAGCRSIKNVRDHLGVAGELTAAEAQQMVEQGMALYNTQPRELARVEQAGRLLREAASVLRDDYRAQWQTAQVMALLAEEEARPKTGLESAQKGIVFARRARELKADGVEGLYWFALNVGLLADVDRAYGLDAVKQMEAALKQAIDVDERYDLGGPLRVLAILHLRTPQPPAGIGSPRKALRLLQHAVELFPEYPENYLYLSEALREVGRRDEARQALEKVLHAKPWPDRESETQEWKTQAGKLQQQLEKP